MEPGSVLKCQKTKPACHPGDPIFLKCLMTLAAAELKNIKKLPLET